MAKLTGNSSNVSYSLLEKDVYEARIARVVIIGAQKQKPYKGKPKPDAVVAKLTFEIIGEEVEKTTVEDGETKAESVPALQYRDIRLPAPGVKRGAAFDVVNAALGMEATPGDTQDYADLVGAPVMLTVGQYERQDGNLANGVDAISAMGKRQKASLGDLTIDTLFFDCYDDSDDSKEAWKKIGNFAREKVRESSDVPPGAIPAVAQDWPETDEENNNEY